MILHLFSLVTKLFFVFSLVSCMGGSKGVVTFKESDFPVSMTTKTFIAKNRIAKANETYVVGFYKKEFKSWSTLWGFVNITGPIELGDDINNSVSKVKGDAVDHLMIKVKGGFYRYVPILSVLPFWPGEISGTVLGRIIRYKKVIKPSN